MYVCVYDCALACMCDVIEDKQAFNLGLFTRVRL